MTKIAMLLGLKDKPACEPCLEQERVERLARVEDLLADIAGWDDGPGDLSCTQTVPAHSQSRM